MILSLNILRKRLGPEIIPPTGESPRIPSYPLRPVSEFIPKNLKALVHIVSVTQTSSVQSDPSN